MHYLDIFTIIRQIFLTKLLLILFSYYNGETNCGDMDCDGVKRTFIKDLDGSLLGTGDQPSVILTQSDYGWNGDPVHGLNDDKIPYTLISKVEEQDSTLYDFTGTDALAHRSMR